MDKNFTNNDELIMAYLDGELDNTRRDDFQKKMAADVALQLQFDDLLLTKKTVQFYGLQQRVAGLHKQMMQELRPTVRITSSSKRIYRIVAAAAAAILLFVAGYWFLGNEKVNAEKVFAANYATYELRTTRSNGDEAAIEKAYRSKDYATVLQLRDNTNSPDAASLFLSGVAAMELNKIDISITNFNKLLENNKLTNSVSYNDDAEYYLGLAYFKNKNYKMAYELMNKIGATKEHTYHSRVTQKLLSQIEKLMKN